MHIYTYMNIHMWCQDTKTTFHSWVNVPIIVLSEYYPTILKSSLKTFLINYIKTISTAHIFVCALCLIICVYFSLTLMLKHWKMHRYLTADVVGFILLRPSSANNKYRGHWGSTSHPLSALPQSHDFPSVLESLPSRTAMCLHHQGRDNRTWPLGAWRTHKPKNMLSHMYIGCKIKILFLNIWAKSILLTLWRNFPRPETG